MLTSRTHADAAARPARSRHARGARRQPLAERHRLARGRGLSGQVVHLHQGERGHRLRRSELRDQSRRRERRRARRSAPTTSPSPTRPPATGRPRRITSSTPPTPAPGDLLPVLDLERSGGLSHGRPDRLGPRPGSSGSTSVSASTPSSTARRTSGRTTWATRPGSPTTATRCCGSPTGRPPRIRPCPVVRGAPTAGRSGSTRRAGSCRASPAGSTSTGYNGSDLGRGADPVVRTRPATVAP